MAGCDRSGNVAMTVQLYLAFVVAVAVLIAIPGPNVALIVANSIAHGVRFGLLTVMGTSSAMVVQLGLTVLGMSAALGALADWFSWIRWIGVVYLVCLGLRAWRAAPVDFSAAPAEAPVVRRVVDAGFWSR